jgi:DNA-binding transcriptional LysR family regulator
MDLIGSMKTFARVIECGSFSAVARETGLSQPTISKQVAALEFHLGTKLISRSTRQIKASVFPDDLQRTVPMRFVAPQ